MLPGGCRLGPKKAKPTIAAAAAIKGSVSWRGSAIRALLQGHSPMTPQGDGSMGVAKT